MRDQKEQENLIDKQISVRKPLQVQLNQLQSNHDKDRTNLIRDLSYMANMQQQTKISKHSQVKTKSKDNEIKSPSDKNIGNSIEPEM